MVVAKSQQTPANLGIERRPAAADQKDVEKDDRRTKLRKFGLVVGGVFAALAGWLAYRGRFSVELDVFAVLGGALILLGLVMPMMLDPIERIWMKIGHGMGWVNTRILLGVVFFVVLTPMSMIMRLIGRDPLHRKFDRSAKSYWQTRAPDAQAPDRYTRQF